MPVWIFSRRKGSRRPSRLTTMSSGRTTLSTVLKRCRQCSQRRRRWIVPPWSRESVTRDSWNPQYGHFMAACAPCAPAGEWGGGALARSIAQPESEQRGLTAEDAEDAEDAERISPRRAEENTVRAGQAVWPPAAGSRV